LGEELCYFPYGKRFETFHHGFDGVGVSRRRLIKIANGEKKRSGGKRGW